MMVLLCLMVCTIRANRTFCTKQLFDPSRHRAINGSPGTVPNNCMIFPYYHIGPNCHIGPNYRIGLECHIGLDNTFGPIDNYSIRPDYRIGPDYHIGLSHLIEFNHPSDATILRH